MRWPSTARCAMMRICAATTAMSGPYRFTSDATTIHMCPPAQALVTVSHLATVVTFVSYPASADAIGLVVSIGPVLSDRISMGPGPCNPYPEVVGRDGSPDARSSRPRVPGPARRDLRSAAHRVPDRQRAHAADQRDGLGRHGGGVRQRGEAGRRGRRSASTACSASGWSTWLSAAAPVVTRRRRVGHAARSRGAARRASRTRRSSRWSTPKPPPACATTSRRSARASPPARCCWSTASRRSRGIELDVDGWGVDIAYAGTQKCLGVPPGLAPLTYSDAARRPHRRQAAELVPRPVPDRRVYIDGGGGARRYHHTAPISMIFALARRARRHSRRGAAQRLGAPRRRRARRCRTGSKSAASN